MPSDRRDFDPAVEMVQVGTHQYVVLLCPMLTAAAGQPAFLRQGALRLSVPAIAHTAVQTSALVGGILVAVVLGLSFLTTGRNTMRSAWDPTFTVALRPAAVTTPVSASKGDKSVPMHAAAGNTPEASPPSSVAIFWTSSSSSSVQSSVSQSFSASAKSARPTRVPAETSMSAAASSAPFARIDNKVGVYLTANSVGRKAFVDQTITDLRAVGGTALVFDVKGSRVFYHSAAPMANDLKLVVKSYDLPTILAKAREQNLYTIARFVAIKDEGLTSKLPATSIRHPKSGKTLIATWVDPSNETAIEYNTQVVCELAAAGIDEINLDYIRFSTAVPVALMAYSGHEKADRVEKFIRAVRETINRCGPSTKLGLSTFAILAWDYEKNFQTLGQDVARFAPLVDIISPMAYPATFAAGHYYNPKTDPRSRMYYLVHRTLTGYRDMLGPVHTAKLRPWIQGYSVTKRDMREQIDAVYDAGLCGYTVWNASNSYKATFAALSEEHTRPIHCDQAVAVQ